MNVRKPDNKVLACVDQSQYAEYVADYAAWAAKRMDAPLEFLHILDRVSEPGPFDDHSGAIGVDAQKILLDELSSKDEAFSRSARETGRVFLNALCDRVKKTGIAKPDMRQRHGELQETLVEQQDGTRLLVIGRRGAAAKTSQRDLGRNVERVVRALNRPILAVTDDFKAPEKILFAFDGSAITRRGIDMVADSPLFKGLPIHLLMAGKERPDSDRKLKAAHERLETSGFEVTSQFIAGDPEAVIALYIAENDIDMLIMGAYTHSPLRSLVFGSKTTDLLRSAKVPTLLLR